MINKIKNYMELNSSIINGKVIHFDDLYKEEFLSSLKVFDSGYFYGTKVDVVVLPQGTAIEVMGTNGGGMAQPFFKKGQTARIIIHDEALTYLEEDDFEELLEHELGHLLSLTDNFNLEFDSREFEIVDPREVRNLITWADKQADFWDKVSPVIKREQITLFLKKIEAGNPMATSWLSEFINVRELAANYHMIREHKSLSLINLLAATTGALAVMMTKCILQAQDNFEEFSTEVEEEIKSTCEKEFAPIYEVYKSFL